MTVLSKGFLSGLCLGTIVTTVALRYVRLRKPNRDVDRNKRASSLSLDEALAENGGKDPFAEEQLIRTTQFFGRGGVQKLHASHVVVVGLGGVGSHCAVSLARSGVGRLTLIDFDQVTLSSLNRHASATREDVGVPKVEALKDYLRNIFPQLTVDTHFTVWKASDAASLLLGPNGELPDFVVDCIDNVPTKAALIHFCFTKGIRCISAGAAGGKCDPTRIRIDDISMTREDELCRAIRTRLRKEYQIREGPLFCYSTEREEKLGLLPLHDFQVESPDEFRPIEHFRVRIVPVIAPLPAIFGQAMASYVMCELAERPIKSLKTSTKEAEAEQRLNKKNYRQLFEAVKQFHTRADTLDCVKSNALELNYAATQNLFLNKFKGTCVLTQKGLGPRALQLVPWRPMFENNRISLARSFQESNLVCMEQKAAQYHLKQLFAHAGAETTQEVLANVYDNGIIERVDALLQSDF